MVGPTWALLSLELGNGNGCNRIPSCGDVYPAVLDCWVYEHAAR